jgi:hypothetical protein
MPIKPRFLNRFFGRDPSGPFFTGSSMTPKAVSPYGNPQKMGEIRY